MEGGPITDEQAESLLRGRGDAPLQEPALGEVAALLSELRNLVPVTPPVPSARLAAWWEVGDPAPVRRTEMRSPGLGRRAAAWVAALGIGTQVALGSTLAAAAATGAGFAGFLPDPLQHSFDEALDRIGVVDRHGSGSPGGPRPDGDLLAPHAEPDDDTATNERDRSDTGRQDRRGGSAEPAGPSFEGTTAESTPQPPEGGDDDRGAADGETDRGAEDRAEDGDRVQGPEEPVGTGEPEDLEELQDAEDAAEEADPAEDEAEDPAEDENQEKDEDPAEDGDRADTSASDLEDPDAGAPEDAGRD